MLPFVLSRADPGAAHTVYALATRGTTVYAGGGFSTIGGQATPWNPSVLGTVTSLVLDDRAIYIGGNFSSVDGLPQASVVAIDLPPKRMIYLPLLVRQ